MLDSMINLNSRQGIPVIIMTVCGVMYTVIVLKSIISEFGHIFLKKYARKHRLIALILLLWLIFGMALLSFDHEDNFTKFLYDAFLGVLGIATTVSAVQDFSIGHETKKNVGSGILDLQSKVHLSEIQEHVFYQITNLIQIIYLHYIGNFEPVMLSRLLALACVTSIWAFRKHFPINSFKDNYTLGQPQFSFISIMYRTKKYQYVLYKHALLHGLNATLALSQTPNYALVFQPYFRRYWLCLNTSYVMEFFLQSLVKGGYMPQSTMLFLQQLLMTASTISAYFVLKDVDIAFSVISLILNFVNRGYDVLNIGLAVVLRTALLSGFDIGLNML